MQNFTGKDGFIWWQAGIVESRKDPLKLGRYKIRIPGWHNPDKNEMPTESLPWAHPSGGLDHGRNVVGLREGDWCWGFFKDGVTAQEPVVAGWLPGIPEKAANPDLGFSDPTPDDELTPELQPRPPEYSPIAESAEGEEATDTGRFSNPNVLPGDNLAFGELAQDFDPQTYKFDENKDGTYNAQDAEIIINQIQAAGPAGTPVDEDGPVETVIYPMSRYPLEQELKEPISSRLARNEKIEQTIVAKKRGNVSSGESANHPALGVGTDEAHETEPFTEPKTPYDAKYPFNHVYQSESGMILEIDDTPGAERIHEYHRSGSFREVHPDGTRIRKGVQKGYDIFLSDYFFMSEKTASCFAKKDFLIKAGEVMNLESGSDMNQDSGGNRNIFVGGDENRRIGGNNYVVIDGDVRILVKGNYNLAVEGDVMIKAKGDFLVEAANTKIDAHGSNCLHGGDSVTTETPSTSLGGEIKGAIKALTAASLGDGPDEWEACDFEKENTADNKDNLITSSTPKEGFIIYGEAGDLYKPESDSNGKLVTLSPTLGVPHILYEAWPTGELQDVEVEYKHVDGTITTWSIKRPVFKRGRFIEQGIYSGNGNGGRDHYRWSKAGSEYPIQMILNISERDYVILDSGVRHESFGGPYRGY